MVGGRKKPKTLSGIETANGKPKSAAIDLAGKNLKPYQGLKLKVKRLSAIKIGAGKNLKPYQGLKPSAG